MSKETSGRDDAALWTRRRLRGAAALVAVLPLLTACAVDAGSAGNDKFVAHMEGVEGVTAASGGLLNTLPFLGSGSVAVELDPAASEETITAAVQHARAFDPGPFVKTSIDSLDLGTEWVPTAGAGPDPLSSASISVPWETSPDAAIDALLELREMPGEFSLSVAKPYDPRLRVGAAEEACALADQLERVLLAHDLLDTEDFEVVEEGFFPSITVRQSSASFEDSEWFHRSTCGT